MKQYTINVNTQYFIEANDYSEAIDKLNELLDKIPECSNYRETYRNYDDCNED